MKIPKLTDSLSKVSLHLSLFLDNLELAIATGFAYQIDGKTFIVTARHNLTGRHATTNQPLSKTGALPNRLVVRVWDKEVFGKWIPLSMALYKTNYNPIWLEHPHYTNLVDVAAIPIDLAENLTCYPINNEHFDNIPLTPGLDVFILGFPLGISSGGRFPIWKRGSIATEPDFDIDKLPKLLIDTATRQGMSGSPVIAARNGYWLPEGETDPEKAFIGEGRRFIGLYSGRIGDDEFQAQLGIVWKESAILEIINQRSTA